MIKIDGSQGEGGGQVLRTSLALSLVTGKPFTIERIRAGRPKPGLMRQHLTAVKAASEIGGAEVRGDSISSMDLSFVPGAVKPGSYRYAVGTAGSCTLVLQTVLPALMLADSPSELHLEGGTHNPFAPPFDFLSRAFLPVLSRMGATVSAELKRPGFYPAGGGELVIRIEPVARLNRLDLMERGEIVRKSARAAVAQIMRRVADREIKVVKDKLGWDREAFSVDEVEGSRGPGNIVVIEIESEHVTEVFTGFGERGILAETVAEHVADSVLEYLGAVVPVGRHLADQLLIPMALAGGGSFSTLPPSRHTLTNIEVLKQFLDVEITAAKTGAKAWVIEVAGRAS